MTFSVGASRIIHQGIPLDGFKKGDWVTLRGTTSGHVYEVIASSAAPEQSKLYKKVTIRPAPFGNNSDDWRRCFELEYVYTNRIERVVKKREIEFNVYNFGTGDC